MRRHAGPYYRLQVIDSDVLHRRPATPGPDAVRVATWALTDSHGGGGGAALAPYFLGHVAAVPAAFGLLCGPDAAAAALANICLAEVGRP